MRKTGIEILGDVPWGTHFCHFYKTKEDLIDILIPYFKAGLENNEFCMWVVSEPLKAEEAKAALKKKIKNLDTYIKNVQIEILDTSQWYTKSRLSETDNVLEEWSKKEKKALTRGYDGLRCARNTSWLEKKNGGDFAEYESKVTSLDGKHRILTVCSYSLEKYGASEVLDLVNCHQFALLKRGNRWEIIESTESKKAYAVMQESEERWRFMVQNTTDIIVTVASDGTVLASNRAVLNITSEEVIGKNIYDYIAQEYCGPMMKSLKRVFQTGKPDKCTIFGAGASGLNTSWYETIIVPIKHNSHVVAVTLINRDITQLKKAEEALQESEEKLKTIIESINDVIFQLSPSGIIKYVSPKVKEIYGYDPKELIGKHLKKITPMSDVPKALRALKSVLSGKTIKNFEINQLDSKGMIIPMEINIFPVKKEGKIIAVQGVMRVVTEREQAEGEVGLVD